MRTSITREAEKADKDRRGIQSIEVGGQLLRVLMNRGAPMMLRDLAREAGMPAAKAHPYLVSFGKIGLIEQDALTGRYELGPLALQMGLVSLQRLDPLRLATPAIAELSDRMRHTVAVAVWGNHGPTIVRIEEAGYPLHVNLRIGTVMSLFDTATGRVFAAFLPAKLTQSMIDQELQRLAGVKQDAAQPSWKQIEESIAEVRKRGLARAVGQPIPGINAFSAPVFDHTHSIVLAITVLGPAGSFDVSWNSPIAGALADCAESLSRRLGSIAK